MDCRIAVSTALLFALYSSEAIAEADNTAVIAYPNDTPLPWCMSVGRIETYQSADGKGGDALKAALKVVAARGGNTLTTDTVSHLSDTRERNWTTAPKIVGEGFWCPEISVGPSHVRQHPTPIDLPALPLIKE